MGEEIFLQSKMDSKNENSEVCDHWLSLDQSLQKIKFPFRCTGLNIQTRRRTLKENCIFSFNFLWLNTDIIGTLYWVLEGIVTGKKFNELTYVSPCLTLSILGDFKAGYLIANEKEIHKLLDNLRRLERNIDMVNMDENLEKLLKPDITLLNYVIKVLNVLNCLMIVVFDLSPLILIAVKYFKTKQVELLLPFLDVYPFDSFNIRYWPFAYIHQIWSECVVLLQICATDYLFFTCCTHIKIQFEILKYHMERIILTPSSAGHSDYNIEYFHSKLEELIEWHQELINTANMFEVVYSKSTLFNFLTSSLVICLTGFNIVIIDDIAFVVTFLIFLMMSMLQIFFLCFFGNILMSSSMEISDAVYNCKWYTTDASLGKKILLVQTRAQKPCKLTAAGFADVNLRAFMKILSTAWSYFALLQTVYSSNQS